MHETHHFLTESTIFLNRANRCLIQRYCFLRNRHAYFGKDVSKTVFDKDVQRYVFIDKYNALKGHTKYMSDHPEEYEKFSFREQAWQQVKYGYFVLMGNYKQDTGTNAG